MSFLKIWPVVAMCILFMTRSTSFAQSLYSVDNCFSDSSRLTWDKCTVDIIIVSSKNNTAGFVLQQQGDISCC